MEMDQDSKEEMLRLLGQMTAYFLRSEHLGLEIEITTTSSHKLGGPMCDFWAWDGFIPEVFTENEQAKYREAVCLAVKGFLSPTDGMKSAPPRRAAGGRRRIISRARR